MTCPACGGLNGRQHSFREMKYGTRDKFTYWECLSCGCLQIAGIPDNIASYYRGDFYQPAFRFGPLELWLYQAYRIAPRFVGRFRQAPEGFRAVLEAGLEPGARILDVGCGGGKLVRILRSLGYEAHGIDPFVHEETPHVSRKYLEDTSTSEWDMIMFHHSLEHMTDHVRVLSAARERLAPGGTCLVRMPVATWAWGHYKEDWAQLDAPRHFIIHTPGSFSLTLKAAGFEVGHVTYDSNEFQFYASEAYQRDTPLLSANSRGIKPGGAELRKMRARAAELNQQRLGDQAAFFLTAAEAKSGSNSTQI